MIQYLEPSSSIDRLWGKDVVTHTVTTEVKTAKRKVTGSRGRRDYFLLGACCQERHLKVGKIPTGRNIKGFILSQAEWQQKNIGIGRHGLKNGSRKILG